MRMCLQIYVLCAVHTQAEYEQFKAECIRLQEDFNKHKEKYFTDYVAADMEQGANYDIN